MFELFEIPELHRHFYQIMYDTNKINYIFDNDSVTFKHFIQDQTKLVLLLISNICGFLEKILNTPIFFCVHNIAYKHKYFNDNEVCKNKYFTR